MRTTVSLLAAAGGALIVSASALAQAGSGASITNNNITWTQADWQTTNTAGASAYSAVNNNLRVNDLPISMAQSFTNFVSQNEFFYRFTGTGSGNFELRERNFANLGTPTITGNVSTWTFSLANSATNFAGQTLAATLTQTVTGQGNGRGRVDQTLTLTNNSAQPAGIAIFNWARFQAGLTISSANTVSNSSSGPGQFSFTTTNLTSSAFIDPETGNNVPVSVTFSASGLSSLNNGYQFESFSTSTGLLPGLTNSTLTSLTNAAPSSGNLNSPTGAFRWDLSIPAGGGSASISSSFSIIPAPGAAGLLGLAGLLGMRRRR
jgi:MYXO-CTERM domain-containing protein